MQDNFKLKYSSLKVNVKGAGAAGTAIAKLLMSAGFVNVILCDKKGTISLKDDNLPEEKRELAWITDPDQIVGTLKDALKKPNVLQQVA